MAAELCAEPSGCLIAPTVDPRVRSRLPGLELLRGVAALCVLLLHAPIIFGLRPVFSRGYLGVDLFFIISGYVMARNFAARPPAGRSVAAFLFDRYARMWPMMVLGGIIGLPLLRMRLTDTGQFFGVAIANLLLVPVPFRHEAYPLNVPAWTIVFILLGNLLHRLLLRRLRGPALAFAIAVAVVAMGVAAASAGGFNLGSRPEELLLALPRLMLGYFIGVAIFQAWGDSPPFNVPPLLAFTAMPGLLAVAWWAGTTSWLFDLGFVVIACPLMIAGAMRSHARWATFAGAWSFPLYAIHFPLLIRLRNAGVTAWQAVAIVLLLSALATWLEIRLRARLKAAGGWRVMIEGAKAGKQ